MVKRQPRTKSKTVASTADAGRKATHATLDTPELLEQILSHLPIKTLTHCLRVSRYWQASITASLTLQRNLFLAPEPTRSYLEWKTNTDNKWHFEERRYQPTIVFEPGPDSKLIVRAHPLFQLYNRGSCLEADLVHDAKLRKALPDTLAFQPPLSKISISIGGVEAITIERRQGVTIGAIRRQLAVLTETDSLHTSVGRICLRTEGAVAAESYSEKRAQLALICQRMGLSYKEAKESGALPTRYTARHGGSVSFLWEDNY